jgi:hypothetical protein
MVEVKSVSDLIEENIPRYKKRKEEKAKDRLDGGVVPEAEHVLVYESAAESLEPLYFFIIDLMSDMKLGPEKLVDNFVSSPGSGHFAELGQRATIMQQQGTKILGDINTVLRSVLNLVYDLKEFKIRLQLYDDFNSKDENKKTSATLSLKQLWMDRVEYPAKGNSSIKAMALGQAGFQTLIDAFLVSKDAKHAAGLDLNDRIKRIVMSRVEEFNVWVRESEIVLRNRYKMERGYLKSQMNSLKIYSRWAKPYLRAAAQLEQTESGRNPDLVKTFNTIILQLTVMGKDKYDLKKAKDEDRIDVKYKEKKEPRKFYACTLVDLYFRGIPQKIAQRGDYAFGGKTTVTFRGYVLNEDELKLLNQKLDDSDIEDAFSLIKGATDESLGDLKKEIDDFLNEGEPEKKEEKKEGKKKGFLAWLGGSNESKENDQNPFSALLGAYNKKTEKKEDKKGKKEEIKLTDESWGEKNYIRKLAEEKAIDNTYKVFDIYKKAHGMQSLPDKFM